MKLQVFNGGLNIRQAPELIGANEATVCLNADLSSDQLSSAKGLGALHSSPGAYPYYWEANDEWMANANTRDYSPYQNKLYWSDGSVAKKYNGTTTQDLGITAPTVSPEVESVVVFASSGVEGVVQYVYTYYNSADGTESRPSPVSREIDVTTYWAKVKVEGSTDPQVTNIFVYRVGSAFTSFVKVAELANSLVWHFDTLPDDDVIGEQLTSTLNGKAPVGLKYLAQSYGVFFGAVGEKLYFTRDIGNPNYWPETYYIDFDLAITGLAVISSGLAVFTKYETYLISGTNSSTFVKYLISSDQGCITHNSIVTKQGAALFMSTDGLCTVSGNNVVVLSKSKLGKQTFSTVCARMHDEVYYAQLTDGTILSFDVRYAPTFSYYNFNSAWLVVANDVLYANLGAGIYPMFAGGLVPYNYTTGNITEGSLSELKQYNTIYAYVTGTHTLNVYINNILVATRLLLESKKPIDIAIPQMFQTGSSIKFELTGTGVIKELEYKAMGRQNGR